MEQNYDDYLLHKVYLTKCKLEYIWKQKKNEILDLSITWVLTKVLHLLEAYPDGITQAILLTELTSMLITMQREQKLEDKQNITQLEMGTEDIIEGTLLSPLLPAQRFGIMLKHQRMQSQLEHSSMFLSHRYLECIRLCSSMFPKAYVQARGLENYPFQVNRSVLLTSMKRIPSPFNINDEQNNHKTEGSDPTFMVTKYMIGKLSNDDEDQQILKNCIGIGQLVDFRDTQAAHPGSNRPILLRCVIHRIANKNSQPFSEPVNSCTNDGPSVEILLQDLLDETSFITLHLAPEHASIARLLNVSDEVVLIEPAIIENNLHSQIILVYGTNTVIFRLENESTNDKIENIHNHVAFKKSMTICGRVRSYLYTGLPHQMNLQIIVEASLTSERNGIKDSTQTSEHWKIELTGPVVEKALQQNLQMNYTVCVSGIYLDLAIEDHDKGNIRCARSSAETICNLTIFNRLQGLLNAVWYPDNQSGQTFSPLLRFLGTPSKCNYNIINHAQLVNIAWLHKKEYSLPSSNCWNLVDMMDQVYQDVIQYVHDYCQQVVKLVPDKENSGVNIWFCNFCNHKLHETPLAEFRACALGLDDGSLLTTLGNQGSPLRFGVVYFWCDGKIITKITGLSAATYEKMDPQNRKVAMDNVLTNLRNKLIKYRFVCSRLDKKIKGYVSQEFGLEQSKTKSSVCSIEFRIDIMERSDPVFTAHQILFDLKQK